MYGCRYINYCFFHENELNSLLCPIPKSLKQNKGSIFLSNSSLIIKEDINNTEGGRGGGELLKGIIKYFKKVLEIKKINVITKVDDKDKDGDGYRIELKLVYDENSERNEEEYKMEMDKKKCVLKSGSKRGIFNGIQTFIQLVNIFGNCYLPLVTIEDYPDINNRGVMLDISRDKVPKLETLYGFIDIMASLKFNELQLYIEHAYQYQNHKIVWERASPITPQDIRMIDEYCKQRYIKLIPNQQCLGHMHRWLQHKQYLKYAEIPSKYLNKKYEMIYNHNGFANFSLAPNEDSVEFMLSLYDEFLPNFSNSSEYINIDADETWDIGKGTTKELRKQLGGIDKLYLKYIKSIHKGLIKRYPKSKIQIWADMLLSYPKIINDLPESIVLLIWGYERNNKFERDASFLRSRVKNQFYVCPSSSRYIKHLFKLLLFLSWNTFGGRTENCLINLSNAAISGKKFGALGYLITIWGDNGHMQNLATSYLSLVAGSSYSWNVSTCKTGKSFDFARVLNTHVLFDCKIGEIMVKLGNVYQYVNNTPTPGCSDLFRIIIFNGKYPILCNGITITRLNDTIHYIKGIITELDLIKNSDLKRLYQWISQMQLFSCNLGIEILKTLPKNRKIIFKSLNVQKKKEFYKILLELIEEYKNLWLKYNRKGGLDDSIFRLNHLLELLK